MAQGLRALIALTENLGSIPGSHIGWLRTAVTPVPEDSKSSGFYGHLHAHATAKLLQSHIYSSSSNDNNDDDYNNNDHHYYYIV